MKSLPTSTTDEKITFIKLARRTRNHWLWKASRKKTKFEAWLDLLFRANFEESKEPFGSDLIELKRGDILCSQEGLAKDWGWDRSAVRHFINILAKDQMLTVKVTNKFTVLTLCNYERYNDQQPTKNQQDNNKPTTSDQQTNTYKNIENNKNNKKFIKPSIELAIEYFLEQGSSQTEAESFYDHYQSNGWKIGGKSPMSDWQAASRNWIRNNQKWNKQNTPVVHINGMQEKLQRAANWQPGEGDKW